MDDAGHIDLEASVVSLDAAVTDLLSALPADLAPHDGFDVIANLLLENLPWNPDTYKETEHPGLSVVAEIAALATIERGTRAAAGAMPPLMPDTGRVARRIKELAATLSFRDALQAVRERQDHGPISDLAHLLRSRDAMIRGPTFPHQEKAAIQGIFGDLDAPLMQAIGFTADEALALCEGCSQGATAALTQRARDSLRHLPEITRMMRGRGQSKGRGAAKLAAKQARRSLAAWVWFGVGTTLSVTAATLAERSGLSVQQAQAFLDLFSLDIGCGASTRDFVDHKNPLTRRPLIHDGAGNYLCSSFSNLFFALRPTLSEHLLESRNRERFARQRGRYLESAAVAALTSALRPTTVLQNVKWTDGAARYETDGLLILDTAAVIVEAKSHLISAKARRISDRLNDDLEQIIKESADQAVRLRTVIERDHALRVVPDRGSAEVLDLASVRHVYCLTVALEDLTLLTTASRGLASQGLQDPTSRQPLALSLHSLEVICDLVEYPAQLLHYFSRRARAHEQGRFGTFEELDFFGYYLKRGLYKDADDTTPMWILSMTDDMDAYYLWKSGERTVPAPKPVQDMPPEFRQLLAALEEKRPRTYITCSLRLLEGSRELREFIVAQLQRLTTATDRKMHNVSYTLEDEMSCGITLMSAPPRQANTLLQSLGPYVVARKYRQRLDEWFGIGVTQKTPWEMTAYVGYVEPWQEDELAQQLADEVLDPHAQMQPWTASSEGGND
jgi:hypothetical protein